MSRITDEPYFTYSAYSALTSGIQVKCPKCHSAGVVTADDDNAYFRYLELWFLTSFQGKPVWALNREHLAYLIDYLSADLREKPLGSPQKTQADHLPAFMKTAKNREAAEENAGGMGMEQKSDGNRAGTDHIHGRYSTGCERRTAITLNRKGDPLWNYKIRK